MVVSRVAGIALGFRPIADAFNQGFVAITSVRCGVVIPDDMLDHQNVKVTGKLDFFNF